MRLSEKTISEINEFVASRGLPFTDFTVLTDIVESALAEVSGNTLALQIPGDWPVNYFEVFYRQYPNKKAPDRARKALDKIAKAGKTRFADLMSGLERYILSRDVQRGYVQHPATWLNGGCWKNQEQTTPLPVERPKSFLDAALKFEAELYGNQVDDAGTHHDDERWRG